MSNFPNATVNKINTKVIAGNHLGLARIPAGFDPDQKTLKVVFNTQASIEPKENAPLLDQNNQPMAGVDIVDTMYGHLHTARCSLNGLVALSHDNRVTSINVASPVSP